MASTSTRPAPAANETILTPVITLKGHEGRIQSISYLPDGKQMISGSDDKAARRWDLQAGKEIEKARKVCEYQVRAVVVSGDTRWVVTAGGEYLGGSGELKAWEVDTGIVKTFHGHLKDISCTDISADSMLLASGSWDGTTQIWSLDTSKLVAGPFNISVTSGAVRFSPDSKKLVVNSHGRCRLGVYDIQTQKLDRSVGSKEKVASTTYAPVFWTNKGARILAIFNFSDDESTSTFFEFDASTLETIGAPFNGHTEVINGLALSSDGALVASASHDNTIKLWAFDSRQLLASFHVINPNVAVFSPDTRQVAYTTNSDDDHNIYICNIPPNILASIGLATKGHLTETSATIEDLLGSDAPSRLRRRHNSATPRFISCAPNQPIPLPTRNPQQHVFFRHLRKILRPSSPPEAAPPVLNERLRDPLDIPATSRLHPIHSPSEVTTQGHSRVGPRENRTPAPPAISSAPFTTRLANWWPVHAGHTAPPIVDVPLAQGTQRYATAGGPKQQDEDLVQDEYLDDDPPSQNLKSQQSTAAAPTNAGEHGSDRSCFCF